MTHWQQELAESLTRIDDLVALGLWDDAQAQKLRGLSVHYRFRLTPYYAKLMDPRDPQCPILLQALPSLAEQDPALPTWVQDLSRQIYGRAAPWHSDAIGDLARLAAPRLTHRYGNRALLHVSSMCGVYCRFCFRKEHLNEKEEKLYDGSFEGAFQYLRTHTEISELILTGGDPLSLNESALDRLLDQIAEQAPHVRVVRIHSRMPVTLPSRLTVELAETLSRPRGFQVYLASHFNHPKECTAEAQAGLSLLTRHGIPLLNQSVLLRGINDVAETLHSLFQWLYEQGVPSFYLHHPDWTPGTFGFRLSIEAGRHLFAQLQGRLSGPAHPRYVLDLPQGLGKIDLMSPAARRLQDFQDETLGGALYEAKLPTTHASGNGSQVVQYLDLWPRLQAP